jgi:hypothetical protein
MMNGIKLAIYGLLGSKKIQSAIIGGIVVILIKHLPFDDETANQIANGVFLVFLTLIGAQGMTDLGKGDSGQPLTVKEALKKSFGGLLQSKKFYTAIIGCLAIGMVKLFKMNVEDSQKISEGVLALVMVLVGSQGLTDLGKAKTLK